MEEKVKPLLTHLALKFADKQASDTILDQCAVQVLEGVVWRDVNKVKNLPHVVWEVKYLRMRGLLKHHPLIPNLVHLRAVSEKTK